MLFWTNLLWAFMCMASIFNWNHTFAIRTPKDAKDQELLQRGFGQYYSIWPPRWLFILPFSRFATEDFIRLIQTKLPWLLFSIQQPTSPHWLPIHGRQSYWCFHSAIQFYRGQTSWISAKTSFLADFLMVKYDAINPPRPIRPLIIVINNAYNRFPICGVLLSVSLWIDWQSVGC